MKERRKGAELQRDQDGNIKRSERHRENTHRGTKTEKKRKEEKKKQRWKWGRGERERDRQTYRQADRLRNPER